jgi:hypothetical protein
MGVIHKDVVQYTWTARDQLITQAWPNHLVEGAKGEDRYVTPYRILPSSLLDCKKWKAGDSVAISLDKSNERWAVNLFFVDGCEWIEIPSAVTGYKTIGDLCAKLYAHNPNRFPAIYYDWAKKTAKAKSDAAQLLFDYWKNSAYRHATIQSGFNYSEPRYPDKPTEQAGQKLRWVLAKKPVPVKAPVAPGSQTMQMEDPQLDALSADVGEMRRKASRIMELLRLSETIMRGRLTLAQRFTALHTLVDVCANSHPEANPDAVVLAGTSRSLEKKVLDSLRNKPIAEMLNESNAPPELAAALRKSFGYSDDIAGEIRQLGLELVEKLTADPDFAGRCGTWAKLALKKGWAGNPSFQIRYDKLVVALVEVLAALQEVHTPDDFADKLLTILERVPTAPITDDNAIEKIGSRSALDVVMALSGPTISLVTSSVGNTPGPPSLYIAVVQLRATKKIVEAVGAGSGAPAACTKLRDELIGELRRALARGPKKDLADKLEAAIKKNDQEALLNMRRDVLDEIGNEYQSTLRWKGGIVLLQVIAFAMAFAAAAQKENVEVADVMGLVGAGATMIVPIVDIGIEVFQKTAPAALAKLSMGLGAFSAFLGVILGAIQFAEGDKNRDHLAMFVGATSMLGNFCLMVGSLAWFGAPIPGLNVAGLVLIVTSTTISLAAIAVDEATPKTRKMAQAILANIKTHPMYDLLREETEFSELMTTLTMKVDNVFLPEPQNNMFVVDRLRAVGFSQMEVGIIVEQTGAPLMAY